MQNWLWWQKRRAQVHRSEVQCSYRDTICRTLKKSKQSWSWNCSYFKVVIQLVTEYYKDLHYFLYRQKCRAYFIWMNNLCLINRAFVRWSVKSNAYCSFQFLEKLNHFAITLSLTIMPNSFMGVCSMYFIV